jgi:hypothetical protein
MVLSAVKHLLSVGSILEQLEYLLEAAQILRPVQRTEITGQLAK